MRKNDEFFKFKEETYKIYREKMIGKKYRHFKGNIYKVLDIAVHTENYEILVIYCGVGKEERVYARPISMFLSEVDKKKYPDVTQKMRFEEVEE